jgi:hypothetical protein
MSLLGRPAMAALARLLPPAAPDPDAGGCPDTCPCRVPVGEDDTPEETGLT